MSFGGFIASGCLLSLATAAVVAKRRYSGMGKRVGFLVSLYTASLLVFLLFTRHHRFLLSSASSLLPLLWLHFCVYAFHLAYAFPLFHHRLFRRLIALPGYSLFIASLLALPLTLALRLALFILEHTCPPAASSSSSTSSYAEALQLTLSLLLSNFYPSVTSFSFLPSLSSPLSSSSSSREEREEQLRQCFVAVPEHFVPTLSWMDRVVRDNDALVVVVCCVAFAIVVLFQAFSSRFEVVSVQLHHSYSSCSSSCSSCSSSCSSSSSSCSSSCSSCSSSSSSSSSSPSSSSSSSSSAVQRVHSKRVISSTSLATKNKKEGEVKEENEEEREFTVCQITDPHVGLFMSAEHLRKLCQQIVDLNPTFVLLTGDMFAAEVHRDELCTQQLAYALAPLSQLKRRAFACLGNHDYEGLPCIKKGLAAAGVKLLCDEQTSITTEFGVVDIIGSHFIFPTRRKGPHLVDLCHRFPPSSPSALRLMLIHDPAGFDHISPEESLIVFAGFALYPHFCPSLVLSFLLPIFLIYSTLNHFFRHRPPSSLQAMCTVAN
ncbi:AP2 domain transcription factor AP2VIIa-4, variant 2 [Balamuthia mandrillaris]